MGGVLRSHSISDSGFGTPVICLHTSSMLWADELGRQRPHLAPIPEVFDSHRSKVVGGEGPDVGVPERQRHPPRVVRLRR